MLVRDVARRDPSATAVRFGERVVSYAEFDERVAAWSRALTEIGIGRDRLVGVSAVRDVDMVVAVHAIVRAGGAYVPLDPTYPRERLEFMIADSGVDVVIGSRDVLAGLDGIQVPLRPFDDLAPAAGVASPEAAPEHDVVIAPDDLAYVIYTSGSTGNPKGVEVTHRSLAKLVSWAREHFSDSELAVSAATTSLNFDISVFELFVPLALGGSIRLLEDPLAVAGAGHRSDLTMLNAVPSVVAELIRMHGLPPSLKTLVCAGEVLPRRLADQVLLECSGLRLVNAYGPTETTVFVTAADVELGAASALPIGFPLPDVRIYVLNEERMQVAPGEWGELAIAGEWLARGYHNRPDLTAERFLPDTINPGLQQRMYLTGDIGRRRPDGCYEFAGRKDSQVKIRGFRIELGEVEGALTSLPGVQGAGVTPVQGDSGLQSLTAVVVHDAELDPRQLRGELAQLLPYYMIPSRFVQVSALPRLPNGKMDRNAVAELATRQTPTGVGIASEAQGFREKQVADLMAELLGVSTVGREQDFVLDLGGSSLQGVRLLTELWRATGVELPASVLLGEATPVALARALESHGALQPDATVVLQEGAPGGPTLFLLSGWVGQSLGYRRLLEHVGLPALRVIAVCPQPENAVFTSDMSVLVERTLRLVEAHQPGGPYWLGGHSMGGMLAHEVAGRLHGLGRQVWPTILVDSHARAVGPRALADELRYYLGALVTGPAERRRQARANFRQRLRRRQSKSAGEALQAELVARTKEATAAAPGGGVLAMLDATDDANFKAIESWRPSRSAAEAILLWTPEWAGYRGRDDLGWRPYFRRGRLRRVQLDVGHGQMLFEPEVGVLGRLMHDELSRVLRDPVDQPRRPRHRR
jgi:amino acid adenylation domain-containing protein